MRAVFCFVFAVLVSAGTAAAQGLPECNEAGALQAEIAHFGVDGTIVLSDGPRIRLVNIVWPDHTEPVLRQRLVASITTALKGRHLLWKPAAGRDRWGFTPAYLFFAQDNVGGKPTLLQAGLVEKGIVPLWPDVPSGDCWKALLQHEQIAVRARRGHWAPRAQAMRHRQLASDLDLHAGRKIVALWRIDSVRPWRGLYFLNVSPQIRRGPSLSMTASVVSRLTQAGDNPREWGGRWIIARSLLPPVGLSRLRIESVDHVAQTGDVQLKRTFNPATR